MLTIKLNENTNSGMLYAIAYCEDPDIYSEDFWGWDTESDVGYELMEFGSLIQDADVFDSLEAAEDRADDVLSSIFENEVFIVGLDPYTPHNLTGFVKKIIRESINESKSIKEDINDSDEVLTFKRDVNLANDADEIQQLIYELSDGVAEDNAQQAFNENESNDLETLKSAVITAIDIYLEDSEWLGESKSIKESTTGDYVEVAYICDGLTNFHVYGGGFKTSDALVAVEDEKGKRLRLTMGDVCEFYTWYDAKGNVIHEPTYYSED